MVRRLKLLIGWRDHAIERYARLLIHQSFKALPSVCTSVALSMFCYNTEWNQLHRNILCFKDVPKNVLEYLFCLNWAHSSVLLKISLTIFVFHVWHSTHPRRCWKHVFNQIQLWWIEREESWYMKGIPARTQNISIFVLMCLCLCIVNCRVFS